MKTRIASSYSPEIALELYRALVADTVEKFSSFHPLIYFHPPQKLLPLKELLGKQDYLPQQGDDLGERMANAISDLYGGGIRDVLLIGADIPHLPKEYIEMAFANLADYDVVLGPARDGGYYLIGGRAIKAELFEGIEWGGIDVLDKTIENIEKSGLSHHLLPEWYDIDLPTDLVELNESISAGGCPHTASILESILKR